MWPCKFEHSWIVPEGLCLSLFLPHSLRSASIQTMNGQEFNYSPHLSDQIQLENEENPRQARSFLRSVLCGRGHPALSSRGYFPLLVSWPFWKTRTAAFGDPLLGLSHCVWPLQMLINLPDDALSIREPFIPPGLLMTNVNARKLFLLFPDLHAPLSMSSASSPSLKYVSHMTDWLLTLPVQPEFDIVKADGLQVEAIPTRNELLAS